MRVVTELAYHAVFARTMFIPADADSTRLAPDLQLTILHAPFLELAGEQDGVNSDAAIVLHLDEGVILIAGTAYAGEMKKSVFTAMNYYLPLAGVLSLHSAANADRASGKTALFFGLSGTGKTTLSTDPERALIGDDEHAWTESGIFNIEGGCYAKVIRLSEEAEPEIFRSTRRFGTILENVVFTDDERRLDLDDDSVTENTRGAYPLETIENIYRDHVAPHPSHVIMLTADASGVMPPLARARHRAGAVSLSVGLHLEACGHGDGGGRARGDVQRLLRRALHGAPADRVRRDAAATGRGHPRAGLAREHRLGRRAARRRQPHPH